MAAFEVIFYDLHDRSVNILVFVSKETRIMLVMRRCLLLLSLYSLQGKCKCISLTECSFQVFDNLTSARFFLMN